ncbi:hypothetical protein [Dyadobacter alkalitolerans]|uniref:hypothetical protein n=1 Tax=Dyadobacter alkalitolerans TaxID=492736 RepID=UPI0012F7E20A|nr:hypothetical protein [Dyadobacter alkalitolerans]
MRFTLHQVACLLSSINPFIVLLAATILFTGCEHDTRVQQEVGANKQAEMKEVFYQNLSAQMPATYPEAL